MKTARPIRDKRKYSKDIEKKLKQLFDNLIFKGIDEILKEKPLFNTNNDIIQALRDGRIQYVDGKFSGKFNARVSKSLLDIGATFDSRAGMFTLPIIKMPMDINQAVAITSTFYTAMSLRIVDLIDNINISEAIQTFSIQTDYEKTLTDLDRQTVATLKADIQVIPELTKEMQENLAKDFNNNMDLFIQKFTEEEIVKLRQEVEDNAFAGGRASNLEKIIKKQKNTSDAKARFLARQETSLLVSKYREQKYKSLGIESYKWSTSEDKRVRDDHKALNETTQTWTNPPIVDEKTGRRAHPGEDFGCRCLPVPIINK